MTVLNPKQREAVFRAIADPTRREILGLLRHCNHTVGELAGNFRTSRPAISKHLGLLRRVGLVVTKNEGTARICPFARSQSRCQNGETRARPEGKSSPRTRVHY
jgi:DNA-binding transcriptional ArsR family regulator